MNWKWCLCQTAFGGVLAACVFAAIAVIYFPATPAPEPDEDLEPYLSNYHQEIYDLLEGSDKQGLAVIVAMNKLQLNGVVGASADERNMENSFKFLKFAVLKIPNSSRRQLRALIKAAAEFPYITEAPSCKVITFYYAGHGTADSNKNPLLFLSDKKLLKVQDMVSPFEPANAPDLKDLIRLFFFDMCQGSLGDVGIRNISTQQKPLPVLKYAVPAKGNCLVAFAGSIDFYVGGDISNGGYWTRHLSKNIRKDVDIHIALAMTWNETVRLTSNLTKHGALPAVQGPSMSSCMGPFNLLRINGTKNEDRFERQVHYTTRHASPGLSIVSENQQGIIHHDHELPKIGINQLLYKEPQLRHLTSWLDILKNDWRQLGQQLEVPDHELQSIELTQPSQISKLSEMFNKWRLGAYSPYTFHNLIASLEKIKQNRNSPSIRAIYENLEQHQAEYVNKADYVDYMKK